jgi:hypothetical protein
MMKTRAKHTLAMIGLPLGILCLATTGGKHWAAPADQTQAAKAAEVLVRAVSRTNPVPQETAAMTQQTAPEANGSAVQERQAKKYTGELISLNLKDVDLKDFFRLIHEISGLNVIVDANVSGTLTLVLDEVPWDQALDIVLKDNGLSKILEGNVLGNGLPPAALCASQNDDRCHRIRRSGSEQRRQSADAGRRGYHQKR